ncbi:YczE/YyaS/YitT family protein [Loigolactobacillus bifermentans]|uniref:Integral membrane protein n=1 Tax=Loigolactobacillus bifermentans DSM 20003 TaxID=1423726 RepID=A0A0R1GYA5_9LACO|nr:DUF6198 family protein [Loigolactobacillus bifermentans]KRK39103.1 hypothetical protein FC07_GL002823 [Loigolactobacillus bifermentans DSM 20003]
MKQAALGQRLGFYGLGLFVMTIGIALSVKSHLGVSPISSIPYTMTVVWGIEMGKATIILHTFLVLLQILILRKAFDWHQLFQVVVGIIFGYFTTFCNWLATFLPTPRTLLAQLILSGLSIVLIAIGIFCYMPTNLIPLAGEGIMGVIADVTHIPFPKVKVATDSTMVLISVLTCLLLVHGLGSVGLGTILAAILVGTTLNVIMHFFGKWRYSLV